MTSNQHTQRSADDAQRERDARLDAIADRLSLVTRMEMRALAADGVSPHIAAVLARNTAANRARMRTQGRRHALRQAA